MPATLRHEQIQNFLENVTQGRPAETEALLLATPETTQELLRTSAIPFTDNSGRTFNCTAYEYANWTKDVKMCGMLERHMDDETSSQICSRITVKDAKGLIYFQNRKKHCTTHFDFNPLIAALDDLDKKKRNIKGSREEYETSLNMLEQNQLDVKNAQLNVEQARSHEEEVQRNEAAAKEELEKARDDGKKTQDDVEQAQRNVDKAQDNAKLAQRDIKKAEDNVELALRNVKQAKCNVEQARLNTEQAPRNVELAQLDVDQAWRDVPAYIPRDYRQQELRNTDEKNTNQLKELYSALKNKRARLFLELLDTSNKEGILLIDKLLQHIPEDSLLYGLVNHLKQKTKSLPSVTRDAIYIWLWELMKNLNDPKMDNSALINAFINNCKYHVTSYVAKNRMTVNFDFGYDEKGAELFAEAMGGLVAFAIIFTILAVGSFLLLPPGANIMFGIMFTFFAGLAGVVPLLMAIAGIGIVIFKVCEALVAFCSNGIDKIRANSIGNAVKDVADGLSKSNHVTLSFFSEGASVVHDGIPESSSIPEGGFPEDSLISSMI
ncbi:MAG: hypothetical protein Q8M03_08220 [Legionella sp.]|nr:hypothetical protein [Legionella sp.]